MDLIVGGLTPQGGTCLVSDNTIVHDSVYGEAGLMPAWFSTTDQNADHSGIDYLSNSISSAPGKLGFGIMVGQHPWGRQQIGNLFQLPWISRLGHVDSNSISGASINLAIDGIRDNSSGTVTGNTASSPQGTSALGCNDRTLNYSAGHYGGTAIQSCSTPLVWDDGTDQPQAIFCRQP